MTHFTDGREKEKRLDFLEEVGHRITTTHFQRKTYLQSRNKRYLKVSLVLLKYASVIGDRRFDR